MAEIINAENTTAKKEGKRTRSRTIFIRMLIILTLDIIAGVLLKTMRDGEMGLEINFSIYIVNSPVFSIVCGALALVALGFFAWTLIAKKDTSRWLITPLMIAAILIFMAVVPLIFKYSYINRYLITVVVMVIASVLYFVYNLFMHIFYK